MATLLRDPVLRAIMAFTVVSQFGEGLTATLFVPWATDVLHTDAGGYGSLLSAQAIGGVAGALVVGRAGARLDPRRLLVLAAVAFGLIDLILFTYPVVFPFIGPALVGMVVVGLPGAAIGTRIRRSNRRKHRTRTGGRSSVPSAHCSAPLARACLVARSQSSRSSSLQGGGYVIAGLAFGLLAKPRA